jgi:hypothetical protein
MWRSHSSGFLAGITARSQTGRIARCVRQVHTLDHAGDAPARLN